ncbi:MAG TPA: hypothetical protein VGG16_00145 [Streptosporangiaceae bacterium]
MGDGNKVVRKRATGTREHVVAYLAEAGELYDKDGLASTRLAAAVAYPGSSVAFAQLLSGMERSGLIVREVHGKRTYRISLGDVDGFGPVSRAPVRSDPVPVAPGIDYDELARRLLILVVRRLAAPPAASAVPAGYALPSGTASRAGSAARRDAPAGRRDASASRDASAGRGTSAGRGASDRGASDRGPRPGADDAVADLEYELASAWTKHGKLAAENIRLREQLRTAQQSLALARDQSRRLPVSSELDNSEIALLQRLLQQDS